MLLNAPDTELFLPYGITSINQYVEELVQFLREYRSIFDYFCYEGDTPFSEEKVIDFLRLNHWKSKFIDTISHEDQADGWLACLLASEVADLLLMPVGRSPPAAPASLRRFIERAHALKIPYRIDALQALNLVGAADEQPSKLDAILLRGLSPKKQAEVHALTRLVTSVAKASNCDTIVDIGAGQGYLTQSIAFEQHISTLKRVATVTAVDDTMEERHHMTVVAIDTNELQTQGNLTRVDNITKQLAQKHRLLLREQTDAEQTLQRLAEGLEQSKLKAITSHLDLSICEQQFSDLLRPYLSASESDMTRNICMIGLHCCGDLSPTMLRLFVGSDANAIVSVGCCYHRLTEKMVGMPLEQRVGYPMSKHLQQKDNKLCLSTGGRSLACLASARWEYDCLHGKCKVSLQQFRNSSFRCALQVLLYERFGQEFAEKLGAAAGKVPRSKCSSFGEYVVTMFGKLLLRLESKQQVSAPGEWQGTSAGDDSVADETSKPLSDSLRSTFAQQIRDFIDDREQALVRQELEQFYRERFNPGAEDGIIREVAAFWSISAVFADVIEALLLVDRLLYLREQESVAQAQMVRLLDPFTSPRGVCIIACKKMSQTE